MGKIRVVCIEAEAEDVLPLVSQFLGSLVAAPTPLAMTAMTPAEGEPTIKTIEAPPTAYVTPDACGLPHDDSPAPDACVTEPVVVHIPRHKRTWTDGEQPAESAESRKDPGAAGEAILRGEGVPGPGGLDMDILPPQQAAQRGRPRKLSPEGLAGIRQGARTRVANRMKKEDEAKSLVRSYVNTCLLANTGIDMERCKSIAPMMKPGPLRQFVEDCRRDYALDRAGV